jgi:hypothetical protein
MALEPGLKTETTTDSTIRGKAGNHFATAHHPNHAIAVLWTIKRKLVCDFYHMNYLYYI